MELDRKVAIVTGATSGIGRAIVLRLVSGGARVMGAARRPEPGGRLIEEVKQAGGSARFVPADVRDPAQVERVVAEAEAAFGRVDILISAAGRMSGGTAPETSIELWREIIDTNLAGPFFLAKYGIPAVVRAGGGAMVIIASELGLVGARDAAAYCAAKGGLVNLTRALAVDHAPQGVRVNCLCPGPIDTPLLRDWFASAPDPAALERDQLEPVPLGRLGTAEEIAEAAVFLASGAASYFAGSVVVADGGATAWYGL